MLPGLRCAELGIRVSTKRALDDGEIMRRIRTFIAVELSADVRRRAGDLIERLQASGARVNWVAPENMHITLKFLGDQTDNEVATVCRAVQHAVQGLRPFEFTCCGAGAFPNVQRPRTLWIGVQDGAEELGRLQRCVEDELSEQGYVPEGRAFHAHLTLGRVRSSGPGLVELAQLLSKADTFSAGTVSPQEIVVFGSHLQRGGPRYEVLARAPLGGS